MTLLVLLAGLAAFGQAAASGTSDNPELANARALLQAGREQVIRDDLQLTEKEAAAFWPVYRGYRAEKRIVQDRRADMVADFLKRHDQDGFTDEYAEQLIKGHFDVETAILEVQMRYVPMFRGVLPALKVARFYQLENKMDAEVDAQLALVVPLVE
jgi:hypothetical protein